MGYRGEAVRPGPTVWPPAVYPRRLIVEATLFIARTGRQWRYLPERYPPWDTVWKQWCHWREAGVWEQAMIT